ncbi:hypothetical protein FSP39_014443 [Pinctada imbricata]|uniref:Uncharacterized protein n=1 Tax=Pinctada imbricata TaxID=66713 RepID=A0AA89BVP8_PINIB|nr:hypothetical protein FSP39_014443 [Pinctada imbricata]
MVKDIMKEQKDEYEKRLKEAESRNRAERGKLKDEIDALNIENKRLQEMIVKKCNEIDETKEIASSAERKADEAKSWANYNEQYSRKNNVKIYGVPEADQEDTEAEVIELLKSEADTVLKHDEIVAAHRIPGKRPDQARPILVKLKNSDVKSRVIRQRATFKQKKIGIRLADDVTSENSKLMERLNEHEMIESSWYYNGSVYGKIHGSGRKLKFKISDDITERIRISHHRR